MLSSISQNNVELLIEDAQRQQYENLIIVDYAAYFNESLTFIQKSLPHVKNISYFCEHHPDTSVLNVRAKRLRHWSLPTYKKFLFAPNPVSFDEHHPVYDGDVSRLNIWRIKQMAYPLTRLVDKLHRLPFISKFSKIYTALFCVIGMILQIFVPPLRPKQGQITATHQDRRIDIYFNGSPEKDHYGESPLYEERLETFGQTVRDYVQNEHAKTAIMLITGPRHLYARTALGIIHEHELTNTLIYACALYRPKTLKHFKDHNIGTFHKGTNMSMNKTRIFSDHCLAIGAGDRELWRYVTKENG